MRSTSLSQGDDRSSELNLEFANSFLRQLLAWRGPAEDLPRWAQEQLSQYDDSALSNFKVFLSGSCIPERDCPPNLVIGLQAITELQSNRLLREEREARTQERKDDLQSQSRSERVAVIAALVSAIVAGIITLLGMFWTGRTQDRERSEMRALLARAYDAAIRESPQVALTRGLRGKGNRERSRKSGRVPNFLS